ncbi:MAG: heme ABC exporter ATP-binding protein CcmA [Actinomycetota bacterium]|nr:heme ABC exporter ATP-binding protein CcmA [Actinomycetota bacterium]
MGRFPVLAGVDLDVARGEVVALQGANGAGKTSLLRACAGLLRIVSGSAEVLGADVIANPRAARRHTGLYGHNTALYDDLSVTDNVRFALRAARAPLTDADAALDTLGLSGRLRCAPVSALSAGQRRCAAFAALVARDPDLWLLDEPHAGLDAEHRDLLDGLVRSATARGATVILASHEVDRAHLLADRVVTVAGGMVLPRTETTPGAPAPDLAQSAAARARSADGPDRRSAAVGRARRVEASGVG